MGLISRVSSRTYRDFSSEKMFDLARYLNDDCTNGELIDLANLMKQFGAIDFSQLFAAVQDLSGMGDRNITRLSRPEADQLDCGEFLRLNRQLTDKIASQNQILKQINSRIKSESKMPEKRDVPRSSAQICQNCKMSSGKNSIARSKMQQTTINLTHDISASKKESFWEFITYCSSSSKDRSQNKST